MNQHFLRQGDHMKYDHKTIQQWLTMREDNALDIPQQAALDAHLATCVSCRTFAEELSALNLELDQALQARYAVRVSAETRRKQAQLKQHLRNPVTTWSRQLPAFAIGLAAL
ncbi:MAG TPA: hypothetical protein ENJ56_06630, partial [Anaerolineae bacterium]|nr:hypothetical protein [Anaerolineae bacterium]